MASSHLVPLEVEVDHLPTERENPPQPRWKNWLLHGLMGSVTISLIAVALVMAIKASKDNASEPRKAPVHHPPPPPTPFMIPNASLMDLHLMEREKAVSYHFAYTIIGSKIPIQTTMVSMLITVSFDTQVLTETGLPSAVQQADGSFKWSMNDEGIAQLTREQYDDLKNLISTSGKLRLDVRIDQGPQDYNDPVLCPFELSITEQKVIGATPCYTV